MPVFDAKNLDADPDAFAVLAALLHPTREAQARARMTGLRRAEGDASMSDPLTLEGRLSQHSAGTEAAVPTT